FLTLETDQGADLNGDGDRNDLVLQTLNVRMVPTPSSAASAGPNSLPLTRTVLKAGKVRAGAVTAVAGVSVGICTDTALGCASKHECSSGTCFVPPGGCIKDLRIPCDPRTPKSCSTDQFCEPILGSPGQGTCHLALRAAGDPRRPAVCQS